MRKLVAFILWIIYSVSAQKLKVGIFRKSYVVLRDKNLYLACDAFSSDTVPTMKLVSKSMITPYTHLLHIDSNDPDKLVIGTHSDMILVHLGADGTIFIDIEDNGTILHRRKQRAYLVPRDSFAEPGMACTFVPLAGSIKSAQIWYVSSHIYYTPYQQDPITELQIISNLLEYDATKKLFMTFISSVSGLFIFRTHLYLGYDPVEDMFYLTSSHAEATEFYTSYFADHWYSIVESSTDQFQMLKHIFKFNGAYLRFYSSWLMSHIEELHAKWCELKKIKYDPSHQSLHNMDPELVQQILKERLTLE
jgi:hypothetical protein